MGEEGLQGRATLEKGEGGVMLPWLARGVHVRQRWRKNNVGSACKHRPPSFQGIFCPLLTPF